MVDCFRFRFNFNLRRYNLASLALSLSASVMRCGCFPGAAAEACDKVLPAALGLVRSPLMQPHALAAGACTRPLLTQPEPLLTLKTSPERLNTPSFPCRKYPLNTNCIPLVPRIALTLS